MQYENFASNVFALILCLGAGRVAHAQVPVTVSNLAAGKTATQSSTDGPSAASRAIDGNIDGNNAKNSVSHTLESAAPWWMVDLGSIQDVGTVRIYNRTDCCGSRLSNFTVSVSSDGASWGEYMYPGVAGADVEVPVNRSARWVKIRLNGSGILSLAEVQISPLRNIARGKTAVQSSTDAGSVAARAVDGNTNGANVEQSISHTLESANAWWQVDLGSIQSLGQVILHNRTDCCSERLANFQVAVSVDNTNWVSYQWPNAVAQQKSFLLNHPGRYVKVQRNTPGVLSLAEVQVTQVTNLAKGKAATQSSTDAGSVAGRAIDGNVNGENAMNSLSHTLSSAKPWWQVDLLSVQQVGTIVLHNRTDCCANRLVDFKVLVSENGTTWREFPIAGPAASQTYVKVNGPARYVKVQLNGTGILSLAEVEVFNLP